MDKAYKIPVVEKQKAIVTVKAESLEDAIEMAGSIQGFDTELNYEIQDNIVECDCESYLYCEVEESFENIEREQDNIEDLCGTEEGKDIAESYQYNFTEDEFNAIDEAITSSNLSMGIEQFYICGEKMDIFYDFEDQKYLTIQDGLNIIKEAIEGTNPELYKTLDNLYDKIKKLNE